MRIKRIILTILTLFMWMQDAHAQQDPMYSQYMFTMLTVNPAYAGSRDVLSVNSLYRKQWIGLEGAPRTATLTLDMPLKSEKIGLGISIVDDKVGITHTFAANAIYAYRIRIANAGVLSFGIQAGINQISADYTSLDFSKVNGGLPDNAFSSYVNKIVPNFGAGTYYTTDHWYIGLSAPKLVRNDLSDSYNQEMDNSGFRNRQFRHYFLTAGTVFKLNEMLKLKPSVLFKAVPGANPGVDINANLWIKDKLGIGASYRVGDVVLGMVEIQANQQLRFGYAYDISINGLSGYNKGSHEIMLRYEFGFGKSNYLSPRYF